MDSYYTLITDEPVLAKDLEVVACIMASKFRGENVTVASGEIEASDEIVFQGNLIGTWLKAPRVELTGGAVKNLSLGVYGGPEARKTMGIRARPDNVSLLMSGITAEIVVIQDIKMTAATVFSKGLKVIESELAKCSLDASLLEIKRSKIDGNVLSHSVYLSHCILGELQVNLIGHIDGAVSLDNCVGGLHVNETKVTALMCNLNIHGRESTFDINRSNVDSFSAPRCRSLRLIRTTVLRLDLTGIKDQATKVDWESSCVVNWSGSSAENIGPIELTGRWENCVIRWEEPHPQINLKDFSIKGGQLRNAPRGGVWQNVTVEEVHVPLFQGIKFIECNFSQGFLKLKFKDCTFVDCTFNGVHYSMGMPIEDPLWERA